MSLDRSIIKLFILSVVMLALSFSGTASAEKRFESIVQKPFDALAESLTNPENVTTKSLLEKWTDYVKRVTTYSNADYIETIHVLQQQYADATKQMEQCMDDGIKNQEQYNTAWLNKLIKQFGLAYLKNHEQSVILNLGATVSGSYENCCRSNMKELFFQEEVLYAAYRHYSNLFLEFYDQRSQTDQNKLKSRKEAVTEFMDLLNRTSAISVILGRGMPKLMLSEVAAKNANEAIYTYFKENPIGCNINAFKALEDFRKAIGKNE